MTTPAQSFRQAADDLDSTLQSLANDILSLKNDVETLKKGQRPPTDPPADVPEPTPPTSSTDLSIGLSFERYTGCIKPDAGSPTGYRITDPRFIALYSQFDTIRVMDWTEQVGARDRNRSWSTRITHEDYHPERSYDRWGGTGVPIEGLIEVANACNSNIWWNFPQQCDIGFMEMAGTLFDRLLKPGLHVYLEGPNEFWQSNRGWIYHEKAKAEYPNDSQNEERFAFTAQLYAEDCDRKFRAFSHNFDPHRTTRILGGQLANIGVIEKVLEHIGPSAYDAITCSGYFGNNQHLGQDWKTGNHGLHDSINDMDKHDAVAARHGKQLCIYELNQHIEKDLDLVDSAPVTEGVQAMIDHATLLAADPICLYVGVGNRYPGSPWALYDTNYQRRAPAVGLGLPTVEA